MAFIEIIWCFLIFFNLNCCIDSAMGSENEKSMSTNHVRNIELKVNTNIKAETIKSRELLTELIKQEFEALRKEFANQQDGLAQLQQIAKTQETELGNIKKELAEQKVLTKNIKDEFSKRRQQLQENIISQLEAQNMTENDATHKNIQEKLMEEAVKVATAPKQIDSSRWDKNFNCIRNCGLIMDLPESCEEAMISSFSKDGAYLLNIGADDISPFFAYCKRFDDKVWTIMQRREDGSVDFYRNWADYKHGFGNLYGEFWMGLERLHAMTKAHKYELHIWLESRNDAKAFAHYNGFSIANETEKYKLTVGGFSGNATDDLYAENVKYRSSGAKFSTYDNCNDNHDSGFNDCAKYYKGAWWFSKCYLSHLNGPYKSAGVDGVDWNGFGKKLKYVEMAIRQV